jgi:hypothetical protein
VISSPLTDSPRVRTRSGRYRGLARHLENLQTGAPLSLLPNLSRPAPLGRVGKAPRAFAVSGPGGHYHHSSRTRRIGRNPAQMLVQHAASLQRFALVVTRQATDPAYRIELSVLIRRLVVTATQEEKIAPVTIECRRAIAAGRKKGQVPMIFARSAKLILRAASISAGSFSSSSTDFATATSDRATAFVVALSRRAGRPS